MRVEVAQRGQWGNMLTIVGPVRRYTASRPKLAQQLLRTGAQVVVARLCMAVLKILLDTSQV